MQISGRGGRSTETVWGSLSRVAWTAGSELEDWREEARSLSVRPQETGQRAWTLP